MTSRLTDKKQRDAALLALRSNLLFSALQDTDLTDIIDTISLVTLSKNEVLFEQGDAAKSIFLLDTGQLKLSRYSQSGSEKIIEFISPGESFAEALMFSNKEEFPVTATALEDSIAWCLNSQQFYNLLKRSPDACFAVMGEMSRRLHAQLQEIDNLALQSATLRVVYFLLNEASSAENRAPYVILKVSKVALAARLSIRAETLSRIFAKLTSEGLLEFNERRVNILNLDALEQILLND